jgi:hypothetical protein
VAALVQQSPATEEAVEAALRHTVSPSVLSLPGITKLISRLHKSHHWQKALKVFDALPRLGIVADLPLCNAALGACATGRDTARAELLFLELKGSGLQPDAISINALAIAAGRANDCHTCAVVRAPACRTCEAAHTREIFSLTVNYCLFLPAHPLVSPPPTLFFVLANGSAHGGCFLHEASAEFVLVLFLRQLWFYV